MQGNSVTLWLRAVENHDEAAAGALFDRYFDRILALARRRLTSHSRRVVDEEDIAVTVLHAVLARVGSERFPAVNNRDELWGLMLRITDRKVCDALRKHLSAKRGGGRVRGESVFLRHGGEDSETGISAIPARGETQELGVQFAEEYRRLLALLDNQDLVTVAKLILTGHSTAEIAEQTNRTQRTVQRRLRMILDIWNQAGHDNACFVAPPASGRAA